MSVPVPGSAGPPDVAPAATRFAPELAILCEPDGRVRWCNDGATALLGVEPGASLRERAAPELGAALERLVGEGRASPVDACALQLDLGGLSFVVTFRAGPHEGGVLLVGGCAPDGRDTLLSRLLRTEEERRRLAQALEDSDRGIAVLQAEVEEKTLQLERASSLGARLVANVSHEFRTPLNSILGLSRLLLGRADGELSQEQARQLGFIEKSAETLRELVDDVLDLSRLDAGRGVIRPRVFRSTDLLAALRGVMRAVPTEPGVELIMEEPSPFELETDEPKISQVLRNLVSNALKFTDLGTVVVSARPGPDDSAVFEVRDTGIGIAADDLERIFEEFSQVEHHLKRDIKGTGLGLSLSRRLAHVLGGTLTVRSRRHEGSVFTLTIPRVHPEVAELAQLTRRAGELDPNRAPLLVIEDDRQTLFLYEKYLRGSGFQVVPARSVEEAREVMRRVAPAAVVLDVLLEGETTWEFLSEMKADPRTRDVPILVVTVTNHEQKARALGADEFFVKPLDQRWLLAKLNALAARAPVERLLVIDDDEVSRYLLRRHLEGTPYRVLEAADGEEGVRRAREERPDVIFLDFVMPGMGAFEVLDELKRDPATRHIPVVIHTSRSLNADELRRLQAETSSILTKQSLSREVAIGRIREALLKSGLGPEAAREHSGG